MKIDDLALIQMEVEEKAAETKSASDIQTSNSLVVQGITFSSPASSRSSKVFQFFWVSETAEKVCCLKCHKVLKGINTSNCNSHLESVHNSVFYPDVREYLQSFKAKQDEKQESEHKALKVRLITFLSLLFLFEFSFMFRILNHSPYNASMSSIFNFHLSSLAHFISFFCCVFFDL